MLSGVNTILEELRTPLTNFIKKRVSNKQDAEEILQEIFIKIYKNIDSLKNDDSINAWIYQVTRNTTIDFYRKKARTKQLIELSELMPEIWDDNQNFNEEIAACAKNMIDSLPEIYRQALILTEYHNLSQKELSERLGLSISGAKSRVQRARKHLKKVLTGCCQLEFDTRGNVIDYRHNSSKCKYC